MTSQHTPGPWSRNIKPATKYPTLFAGRNTHICTVSVSGLPPETVEANLLLIRAAPDLLAALESLVAKNYGQPQGVTVPALDIARAAIAKATGE
ncbi:MAG: hypothetical protein LW848_12960 [Hyphomonadaceae bacterium]|jgi:hypothetical protein|nr:hypothetical protein [Hyphomonadaceae bacterium]